MENFRNLSEGALHFRHTQITKYTHSYSISLQIGMSTVAGGVVNLEPVLQIMEDADFHITHMTGSVTDPTDTNGKREVSLSGSDYGMIFPMAGSPNRGDHGIYFKFLDLEVNKNLQIGQPSDNAVIKAAQFLSPYDQTLISFNDVFSPGYGYSWGKPIVFDYTLMKSKRLKILLQNRQRLTNPDAEHSGFSRVSMAFIGHRYTTPRGQT